MRVVLVTMPWHALDTPSLALGVLHARASELCPQHEIQECYGNIRWAEFLLDRTEGAIKPTVYRDIAENGFIDALGEWLFSSALYGTSSWRTRGYLAYLRRRGIAPGPAKEIQRLAPIFVSELAEEILAQYEPDVVGFTTTFMQNVPSLALARPLKDMRADLQVVFGGGNCDGVQGPALHRNFPFVDFVVSGEGERAFPLLLDAIADDGPFTDVVGLSWRRRGGTITNNIPTPPVPIAEVAAPNFDSYFAAIDRSSVRQYVEPKIVMETSRGCWWGEKHHCTFCGLNGSLMKFRSKPPREAWEELAYLVKRHKTLDVIMVDNIMDMAYFEEFLPTLEKSDWDFRIHYEIKANLTAQQVHALRKARVAHLQPGIESLSTPVLKLMKKGVAASHNVQLLRDCEENNLTVSWNILYGFPGEEASDYEAMIAQMPRLVHLQPPGGAARIALERFSPNFAYAREWFGESGPAACYRYVYDLSVDALRDMVYLYDCPDAGIDGELEKRLGDVVASWSDCYPASSLTYRFSGEELVIEDRRLDERRLHRLRGTASDAYLALRVHTSSRGLQRRLEEEGHTVAGDDLEGWIDEWHDAGLVFSDGERYVALAVAEDPRRVRLVA